MPVALLLAVRMIPPEVMAEARARADDQRLAPSRAAATVIVLLWLALATGSLYWLWPLAVR